MAFLNGIARVVGAITLAVLLTGAGLFVCSMRPTTLVLAQAVSNDALSPYSKDALVELAVLTRDYTVNGADRAATLDEVERIAQTPDALSIPFSAQDERLTLDEASLDHLDDVNAVLGQARIAFLIIAAACVAALAHVWVRCGKKAFGDTLMTAAVAVVALFAALALWVVVDFNGFFATFHSLFFAEGTWTFAHDSLLICMYPPEFWISMGAVWLATTVAGCLICLIIGKLLRKRGDA